LTYPGSDLNINTVMNKQERLHNMFAVAVLRKVVEFQNDKTLSIETLNERIAEYVVDSALDLNLLNADGWTGVFSLNDIDLSNKNN
jgi:hypothetical protein